MTTPTEERIGESSDRTSGDWPGVKRRPLLKALSAGAALSVGSGVATADQHEGGEAGEAQVDQPEGFSAEVIAPHATFTDDVAAAFGVSFEDGEDESTFIRDPSTVVIARVSWEPGGTTGWHVHPGAVLVSVVEGEIEFVFREEDGCVSNTYAAGEAFVDTGGHAEFAENTSDTDQAMAYAIFFSVPDGEPPTTHVEPQDC